MDQIKIGKYIAEKRKGLGYTQVQLAEKLGMSDKSVSKWERGICLPDVSVYENLCDELGISLNEFLAGEDIEEEKAVRKSEENLLKISMFLKKTSHKYKKIIAVFIVLIIFLIGIFVEFLYSEGYFWQNYVTIYAEDSAELEMARVLSGKEGTNLYKYHVDDKYDGMNVKMTKYYNGISYEESVDIPLNFMNGEPKEGMLVFVPDCENGKIEVILMSGDGSFSTKSYFECDRLEVEEFVRSHCKAQDKQKVEQGKEMAILALFYDKDGHMSVPPIENIEENQVQTLEDNDICYYFTVTFDEDENQVLSE